MYGYADGFISPCRFGQNNKMTGYLLFNENDEDVLIYNQNIPSKVVQNGGKLRFFGDIISRKGFKEMTVEKFTLLDEIQKGDSSVPL